MSDPALKADFRRILILSLLILACFSGASRAQSPNVRGMPPEVAERLPGVARLFGVTNASAPPRILAHDFVPGEVLVRFPLGLEDWEIEQVAQLSGAHRVERLSPLGLFLIHGPPSRAATEKLMEKLWEAGVAVTIEPNYLGRLSFVPDDPHHVNGNQWYHEAASDVDLDVRNAWEITRGSPSVVVALVDTGLVVDHPDFAGRLFVNPGEIPGNSIDDDGNFYVDDVSGWNVLVTGGSGNVEDETIGHGTWVAGILQASSDNSHQVAGFDHFAKILPIKVGDSGGVRADFLVAGLDYLVANPGFADVVNLSLGDFAPQTSLGNDLSALAESALLIGASGNRRHQLGPGGADTNYPESHLDVITVGATDSADALGYFSDTGNALDFTAPGVAIYTASWADPYNPQAYHVGDGTSFACPMVSGIASLGLSIRPAMTRTELVYALKKSAVDLGAPGKDLDFGWGRVNAYQALVMIRELVFFDDFESGNLSSWIFSAP